MRTEGTCLSAWLSLIPASILISLTGCSDRPAPTSERVPQVILTIRVTTDGEQTMYGILQYELISEQEFESRLPNLVLNWGTNTIVFVRPENEASEEVVSWTIKKLMKAGFLRVGTVPKWKLEYDVPTNRFRGFS